jgi:hypothetical protein
VAGRKTRVTFSDWAMLGISLLFCALGIFILFRDLRMGAGSLLFFGPCLAFAVQRIATKRRRDRFNATLVSAIGGVELRMSTSRLALTGLFMLCPGVAMFVFDKVPLHVQICGGVFLVAGAAALLAANTGVVSRRFLRFDPEGITLGEWRYSIQTGWDNVTNVAEFEYANNDCVGFDVVDPDLVRVTPEGRHAKWMKGAGNNAALMGRQVIIMPAHFAVDAAPLAMALARYALDARARAELKPRPALTQGIRSGPNC